MVSNTLERRFSQHCLRIFVRDILSDLHRPYPRSLCIAARREGIPDNILVAIWLIERNRRPRVISCVENTVLALNRILYMLLRAPILNLSVGPFQLKISHAATMAGLPVKLKSNRVKFIATSPSGTIKVAQFLRQVTQLHLNATLAARQISALYREYCRSYGLSPSLNHFRSTAFLHFLGRKYNDEALSEDDAGTLAYGRVLEAIARVLEVPI